MNANSFDGASENRSAMNQDLTLTMRDILPELLDDTAPSFSTTENQLVAVGQAIQPVSPLTHASRESANQEAPNQDDVQSQQVTSMDLEAEFDGDALSKYFADSARHP